MQEPQRKDQEIRALLAQLHSELEQTPSLDEEEQTMMRHLMSHIQDILDREEAIEPGKHRGAGSLAERLDEALTRLEVSHPTLTITIKKVLDTLSVAGI